MLPPDLAEVIRITLVAGFIAWAAQILGKACLHFF